MMVKHMPIMGECKRSVATQEWMRVNIGLPPHARESIMGYGNGGVKAQPAKV